MTGRNPVVAAVFGVVLVTVGLVRGTLLMPLVGAALLVSAGVRGLAAARARR